MDEETAIRMARSFVEEANKERKEKGFPISILEPSEVKQMSKGSGWYVHFDDDFKEGSTIYDPGFVIVQVTKNGEVSFMPTL